MQELYMNLSIIEKILLVEEYVDKDFYWVEEEKAHYAFFGLIKARDAKPAGWADKGEMSWYLNGQIPTTPAQILSNHPNHIFKDNKFYRKAYIVVYLPHSNETYNFETTKQAKDAVKKLISLSGQNIKLI